MSEVKFNVLKQLEEHKDEIGPVLYETAAQLPRSVRYDGIGALVYGMLIGAAEQAAKEVIEAVAETNPTLAIQLGKRFGV